MTDKLKEAIEVLKKVKHWIDYGAGELEPTANTVIESIDTVVDELEKDVIMENKLMMILRQLYDHKINIIEAFNRITVREEAE